MAPSTDDYPAPPPLPQKATQVDIAVIELSDEEDTHQPDHLDPLHTERIRLRRHLGLAETKSTPAIQPLFFIERVPDSTPVSCCLPGCTDTLDPGSLRLALNPGMGGDLWFRSASDYYHISCFERLADFTQSSYLTRLKPLTRHTFPLRGLKSSSVADGSYLLPGGVERLVTEWKVQHSMALDKRDGVFDPTMYTLEPSVHDLLYKAGKRGYWPSGRPRMLDQYEYWVLLRVTAVNEWGGKGEEWNLFEEFLGEDKEGAEGDKHGLSKMLGRWERASALALSGKAVGSESSDELTPTAIMGIRRLSTVPKLAGWM
ncbi:hypothetical protein BJY04DRAFT_224354 [Aspergillus karnatakaensis]|uniref:uncharacterized protein n=1 Tax=Aspergillus karnatakaensis TaxID=1810916 RepID=UPI003CCCECE4